MTEHNTQTEVTPDLTCSIGVICYNEAGNIIKLLTALTRQRLETVRIGEIIVVSSACKDGTDALVQAFAQEHPLVSLVVQPERKGKSSAINIFLKQAKHDICVIESGDTVPAPDTIELLVAPFADARMGATGGRPMPVNDPSSLMGYSVHLLWGLHHRMALMHPKLGEMIAFRKVFDAIPPDSAVDEASIEALVRAQGLTLRYIPEAVIHNKGPENWHDHIKQRRRIQNGHLWLIHKQHYKVVSQDSGILLNILRQEIKEHPLQLPKMLSVILIEVYSRLLGSWDYYIKGCNPFAWDIATSTKDLDKGKQDGEN